MGRQRRDRILRFRRRHGDVDGHASIRSWTNTSFYPKQRGSFKRNTTIRPDRPRVVTVYQQKRDRRATADPSSRQPYDPAYFFAAFFAGRRATFFAPARFAAFFAAGRFAAFFAAGRLAAFFAAGRLAVFFAAGRFAAFRAAGRFAAFFAVDFLAFFVVATVCLRDLRGNDGTTSPKIMLITQVVHMYSVAAPASPLDVVVRRFADGHGERFLFSPTCAPLDGMATHKTPNDEGRSGLVHRSRSFAPSQCGVSAFHARVRVVWTISQSRRRA